MGTDEETRRDLLLLLPVDTSRPVSDLHIQLLGENGLQVTATDRDALDSAAPHLESRAYPSDSGPAAADGTHITSGWVARVPVADQSDEAVGYRRRSLSADRQGHLSRRR